MIPRYAQRSRSPAAFPRLTELRVVEFDARAAGAGHPFALLLAVSGYANTRPTT